MGNQPPTNLYSPTNTSDSIELLPLVCERGAGLRTRLAAETAERADRHFHRGGRLPPRSPVRSETMPARPALAHILPSHHSPHIHTSPSVAARAFASERPSLTRSQPAVANMSDSDSDAGPESLLKVHFCPLKTAGAEDGRCACGENSRGPLKPDCLARHASSWPADYLHRSIRSGQDVPDRGAIIGPLAEQRRCERRQLEQRPGRQRACMNARRAGGALRPGPMEPRRRVEELTD
jgi:hypothetical protein